jgi:hypothetical protein
MMNQGDLFKKIGNILTELQDQYQYLAENPQELNELELELFLSNANFLTDHIHIVIKANSHHEVKAINAPVPNNVKTSHNQDIFKPEKEPATFEFLLNDHARQDSSPSQDQQVSQDRFEFEEKEVKEIFNRPLTPEEQQIIAQKQSSKAQELTDEKRQGEEELGPEPFLVKPSQQELPIEEPIKIEVLSIPEKAENKIVQSLPEVPVTTREEIVVIPEVPASVPTVPVTVTETPVVIPEEPVAVPEPPVIIPEAPVKLTLNEKLAAGNLNANRTSDTAVAEIKDLKQAINLNDKLLFVKDLFHGYSLAYAEVIDLVNRMPDFKTADAFLQKNYAIKNDWKSKQATVDRFYELLKRRFPAK